MTMTPERLAELDAVMEKARVLPFASDEWEVAFVAARLAAYNAIPDLRAHIDAQAATIARLQRCLLPVWMTIAVYECIGKPLPDSAVLLQFMGSGASDHVTAGEIRAALTGAA